MEEHLFTLRFGVEQALTDELLTQSIYISIAKDTNFRTSNEHFQNGLPEARVPLTAAVFDFGEFWHGGKAEAKDSHVATEKA